VKKALPSLELDHPVLVIGAGGLGQYGIKLLRILSGAPIIVVDAAQDKRATALELGATHAIDGRDRDLVKTILDLTGGAGVSAAFDFVGSEATLDAAVAATRTLGKVYQVGLAGGTARMKVLENTRFEVAFEATLWGTIKELREVIALVQDGRLALGASETAPLDRINDVYARLKRGEVKGRIIVTPAAA
jgi:alcohol dehydrogenase, propanol-preferring